MLGLIFLFSVFYAFIRIGCFRQGFSVFRLVFGFPSWSRISSTVGSSVSSATRVTPAVFPKAIISSSITSRTFRSIPSISPVSVSSVFRTSLVGASALGAPSESSRIRSTLKYRARKEQTKVSILSHEKRRTRNIQLSPTFSSFPLDGSFESDLSFEGGEV